MKHYTKQERSD